MIGGLGQASQRTHRGVRVTRILDRQRRGFGPCCWRKQREDGWKAVSHHEPRVEGPKG